MSIEILKLRVASLAIIEEISYLGNIIVSIKLFFQEIDTHLEAFLKRRIYRLDPKELVGELESHLTIFS